jgi:hypothetical protein
MTAKANFAAAILAMGCAATSAYSAELPVIVRVSSGREFNGTIDVASNSDHLVLRSTHTGITLKRSIRWEQITSVNEGDAPRDISALRAKFKAPSAVTPPPPNRKIDIHAWPAAPTAASSSSQENPTLRVSQVSFDAHVGNWDADVETDGLVIDALPLDRFGNVLPLGGTLEVELYSPQRRIFDHAPLSGGDTLEIVERWTHAITPDDYGPRGARVQLPFGAITPELQPNWTASTYGLVNIRLSIPGHGVFASSRDGVRVYPWAPNRDRLEMKTGQRFLPNEMMGRRD